MKKVFTIIFVIFIFQSYSQQGELHLNGQPVGSELTIDSSNASIDHFAADTIYIVNTGGVALDITFSRTRKYHKSGWTDQVCDCLICFNTTDTDVWERPDNPPVSIAPGDSCLFQPKVFPNGVDGCSIYGYIIEAQNKTFIDSIDITYTTNGGACFLGEEEIEKNIEFTIYPNPVSDFLTINLNKNESQMSFEIYDLVGKKIKEMVLINGKNQMNIGSLTSGVYFYTIKSSGVILETKKLIVK